MTHRMMTLAVAGAMLLAPIALAAQGFSYGDRDDRGHRDDGYPGAWQQTRCESWQYRPARCSLGGRGRVQLVQVIAGNCVEGRTWGSDRGGVWVDGGCRAVFASFGGGYPGPGGSYPSPGGGYPGAGGGYPGGQPIDVTCQSWQYQPASCPVGPARSAQIVEILGGNCIEGQTWGVGRGVLWVDRGCRARFRAY